MRLGVRSQLSTFPGSTRGPAHISLSCKLLCIRNLCAQRRIVINPPASSTAHPAATRISSHSRDSIRHQIPVQNCRVPRLRDAGGGPGRGQALETSASARCIPTSVPYGRGAGGGPGKGRTLETSASAEPYGRGAGGSPGNGRAPRCIPLFAFRFFPSALRPPTSFQLSKFRISAFSLFRFQFSKFQLSPSRMRKIRIMEHVSLDGVISPPGDSDFAKGDGRRRIELRLGPRPSPRPRARTSIFCWAAAPTTNGPTSGRRSRAVRLRTV